VRRTTIFATPANVLRLQLSLPLGHLSDVIDCADDVRSSEVTLSAQYRFAIPFPAHYGTQQPQRRLRTRSLIGRKAAALTCLSFEKPDSTSMGGSP
jgi:hypothetical protein